MLLYCAFVATLVLSSVAFAANAADAEKKPGTVFRDCPDCPEMVVVPAGQFIMGSSEGDPDEKPVHQVSLSYSFAVGRSEVTQEEWEAVMGYNPSRFKNPRFPVECVSWDDARDFARRLNAKIRAKSQGAADDDGPYRLLSEAEWEYAARAGTTTRWPCGDNESCLDAVAWYGGNSDGHPHPVMTKAPNAFGVYDMLGEMYEWVADCYKDSYVGAPTDGRPRQELGSCIHFNRGGAWGSNPWNLRPANRGRVTFLNRISSFGIRLAKTLN